jgi:hypothetical protein
VAYLRRRAVSDKTTLPTATESIASGCVVFRASILIIIYYCAWRGLFASSVEYTHNYKYLIFRTGTSIYLYPVTYSPVPVKMMLDIKTL